MSLLTGVQAQMLFNECLSHIFVLSSNFSSKLCILNLRGFKDLQKSVLVKIVDSCSKVAHLDLSFNFEVDNEVIGLIGKKLANSLISLNLRSCHKVTDDGIVDMCENLSGAKEKRVQFPNPENDSQRWKEFRKDDLKSNLVFLNVGDIKNLTNRSMMAISICLMSSLEELCVWGDYNIDSDGVLNLCMGKKEAPFRRFNYCGCYRVSDYARLWFQTSFSQAVINYIRIEEFGKDIDFGEVLVKREEIETEMEMDKDKEEDRYKDKDKDKGTGS